jgi:hypothetical protein
METLAKCVLVFIFGVIAGLLLFSWRLSSVVAKTNQGTAFANVYLVGDDYDVMVEIPKKYVPLTDLKEKELIKNGYCTLIEFHNTTLFKNNNIDFRAADIPDDEFRVIYKKR